MGKWTFWALAILSILVGSCSAKNGDQATVGAPSPGLEARLESNQAPVVPPSVVVPASTSTTQAPKGSLVIQGAGDTNLDPNYIGALATNGYGHAFSGLDGIFSRDSFTVVNLECTPSNGGERQQRPFNFRCDPDALPVLLDHGIEAVNLGNNHSMDYGSDALVDGIGLIRNAGLLSAGAGQNRTEAFAAASYQIDGWSIGLVGLGGVYLAQDWLATDDKPGMSDGLDLDRAVDAIEQASSDHDLVVVSIHWCCELETKPNARNREHAEAFVAAGADIIFGHHHHRLQPLEFIGDTPVFWGLGNFVWPRLSVAGSTTAIGRVEIEPGGAVNACLLPVTIVSDGHPELDEPSVEVCADSDFGVIIAKGAVGAELIQHRYGWRTPVEAADLGLATTPSHRAEEVIRVGS